MLRYMDSTFPLYLPCYFPRPNFPLKSLLAFRKSRNESTNLGTYLFFFSTDTQQLVWQDENFSMEKWHSGEKISSFSPAQLPQSKLDIPITAAAVNNLKLNKASRDQLDLPHYLWFATQGQIAELMAVFPTHFIKKSFSIFISNVNV